MTDRSSSKKIMKTDVDDGAGDPDHLETDIDSSIFQLEMVHIELDKLSEKENEEILTVEQKYKKLKQQCFYKRSEIIENIPDFWFNVFTSHPDICNTLHEDEEDCLHYLQKLEVEMSDNIKSGYSIKLTFSENPYFKNDVLVKEISFKQGNLTSVSTKIDWKKPHPMTKDTSSKAGRKRSHNQQTFFGWFSDNDDPASDVISEIIKDDVWPNCLQYYLVPDPDVEGNDDNKDEDTSDSSDTEDGDFDSNIEKMLGNRQPGEASSSK